MIGILTPVLLVTSPLNVGQMIQEVRNWEAERSRTPVEEMINNSLEQMEWDYGSDDTPKQEELLQFPSDRDSESIRRGYNRCSDRPWLRFIQERTGKNCWSGHPREENLRLRGESTWNRRYKLAQRKTG